MSYTTNKDKKCKATDCDKSAFCKELCGKHYQRLIYTGNCNTTSPYDPRPAIVDGEIAKIPLGVNAKDGYALVDADMAWLADKYKFTKTSHGYPAFTYGGKNIKLSNYVLKSGIGFVVDHINRNKLDNRRSNLRVCTQQENARNRKIMGNSSLGYKGIYIKTSNKKRIYAAHIGIDGKQHYLGAYETPEEAAIVYDVMAIQLYGDFACTNIV